MVREIKKSLPKGKQAYTVSFRHPVVKDKAGKNGLKIHRSLSTRDPSEADALVQQLQTLVNEEKWWSSNKKDEASEVFNPVVVSAFYDYMENESTNSMSWDALYDHWSKLHSIARENMKVARSKSDTVLIEVAAQHPLVAGMFPNAEFQKRLTEAYNIYRKESSFGRKVYVYIPGSVHQCDGVPDKVSLSEAGKEFLIVLGVPKDCIFANEANECYKGEQGVYNSTDECFVAAQLFRELGAGILHCVCSSAQEMRKAMSYIGFGCLPNMHTVSHKNSYHNFVDEAFKYLPALLMDPELLQGNSSLGREIRQKRKPQ